MAFLLTAALVFQTLLGNAAEEGWETYLNFSFGNHTFYFYDNYTDYYYPEYITTDYGESTTLSGKNLTESAGSSLQGHLPFFFVLLHLLCFLLQQFTLLLLKM
ncbi:uncharacterized protein ACDP82_019255 [Pangshura tecta]